VRGLQLRGIAPTVVISSAASSPDKGILSLTGKVPTLEYDWVIEPAKSELSLTGYVPTGTAIEEPAEGALALLGKQPKVRRGPTVLAEPQRLPLSLNGYETTRAYGLLLRGHEFTFETPGLYYPTKGVLSLTPHAPEAINTSVPPVEIPTGQGQQLNLTGIWPVLGIINPNQEDTFILEGYAPLAEASSPTFFPGVGRLNITGIDLISDVEGLAPEAYLVLTGQQPNTVAQTVIPGTASLNLTGTLPAEGPEPSAALLSLTGHDVYTRRTVSPSAGAVVASSEAPTPQIGINTDIEPAAGSLTLSGKTPSRNIGFSPTVSSAALAISGHAPTAGFTRSFEIDTQSLQLDGYGSLLAIDLPIDLIVGTLLLNGQTFKLKLKKHKLRGARKRLISLTSEYDIEILYR
jgi:hypothetical protein